jgi:chemotaxis signal transduction protein
LLRAGFSPAAAGRLALASDTASITVMEIVDNLLMWVIPGARDATLGTLRFRGRTLPR